MESVSEQPRLDEEHRVASNPLHERKGSGSATDASRAACADRPKLDHHH